MKDVKDRSRFMRFVNNIEQTLSDLTTLEIKTIIGEYRVDTEANVTPVDREGDFKVIKSELNLLQGDITTYISSELVGDKYIWIRDFHARKEEKGHQIVRDNIGAIKALFELFRETKRLEVNEAKVNETAFLTFDDEIG